MGHAARGVTPIVNKNHKHKTDVNHQFEWRRLNT